MLWKSRKEGILEGDFIGIFFFFLEGELKEHGLEPVMIFFSFKVSQWMRMKLSLN